MPATKQLYDLELLDTGIEREEKTFAENTAKIGDRKLLDAATLQLDALKQDLAVLKTQHRLAEAEVDDLLSKISTDETKLYSGKVTSPKELTSLQQEIAMEKARSDELENKALAIIEQVEAAEKKVNRGLASFEKIETDWHTEQQRLKAENEQLTGSLAQLKQQRAELAGQLDSETLQLYEHIRRQKKPAVSRVEQGICQSCHVAPSGSAMQRARSGQPVQCSCGRILYVG